MRRNDLCTVGTTFTNLNFSRLQLQIREVRDIKPPAPNAPATEVFWRDPRTIPTCVLGGPPITALMWNVSNVKKGNCDDYAGEKDEPTDNCTKTSVLARAKQSSSASSECGVSATSALSGTFSFSFL